MSNKVDLSYLERSKHDFPKKDANGVITDELPSYLYTKKEAGTKTLQSRARARTVEAEATHLGNTRGCKECVASGNTCICKLGTKTCAYCSSQGKKCDWWEVHEINPFLDVRGLSKEDWPPIKVFHIEFHYKNMNENAAAKKTTKDGPTKRKDPAGNTSGGSKKDPKKKKMSFSTGKATSEKKEREQLKEDDSKMNDSKEEMSDEEREKTLQEWVWPPQETTNSGEDTGFLLENAKSEAAKNSGTSMTFRLGYGRSVKILKATVDKHGDSIVTKGAYQGNTVHDAAVQIRNEAEEEIRDELEELRVSDSPEAKDDRAKLNGLLRELVDLKLLFNSKPKPFLAASIIGEGPSELLGRGLAEAEVYLKVFENMRKGHKTNDTFKGFVEERKKIEKPTSPEKKEKFNSNGKDSYANWKPFIPNLGNNEKAKKHAQIMQNAFDESMRSLEKMVEEPSDGE